MKCLFLIADNDIGKNIESNKLTCSIVQDDISEDLTSNIEDSKKLLNHNDAKDIVPDLCNTIGRKNH